MEFLKNENNIDINNNNNNNNNKEKFLNYLKLFLKKYWFLFGIIFSIFLAWLFPFIGAKGGYIYSEYTVKYIAVSLIFFLSGLSLKTKELKNAFLDLKLHFLIQIFNLFFIPFFMWCVFQLLLKLNFNEKISIGLMITACVPTSISSCVVLVKNSKGNDAVALFNASFGNLLGLFITPLTIFLFLRTKPSAPIINILFNLGITVFFPILLGQIIRFFFSKKVEKFKSSFNIIVINNILLLIIIWSTFCDAFIKHQNFGMINIFLTIIIVLICHICFLLISFFGSGLKFLKISRPNRIAIFFCSTQKTIALGVPIINFMYENESDIGLIVLPLLIYHPTQILIGSLLVSKFIKWVEVENESYDNKLIQNEEIQNFLLVEKKDNNNDEDYDS